VAALERVEALRQEESTGNNGIPVAAPTAAQEEVVGTPVPPRGSVPPDE
jgi:hypothetical protein